MMNIKWAKTIICTAMLAGCASTPDVTVVYYFPKATTQIAVVQTLGCSPKHDTGNRIVRSVSSVTVTTAYSADTDTEDGKLKQGAINYRHFDRHGTDTDTAVSFTADGRLSGINVASTGEGELILKSVVGFAGVFSTAAAGAGVNLEDPTTLLCDQIDQYSLVPDKAASEPGAVATTTTVKTLSLTYNVVLSYSKGRNGELQICDKNPPHACAGNGKTIPVTPDASSAVIVVKLNPYVAKIQQPKSVLDFTVGFDEAKSETRYLDVVEPGSRATTQCALDLEPDPDASSDVVPVKMSRVRLDKLQVSGPIGDLTETQGIWNGDVPVPVAECYNLPVPKAAWFGKQQFSLTLSDYGSVTKLEYGKSTGASDTWDAASMLAKIAKGPTAGERAAELTDQNDVLYQQQRQIICETDPTNCASK